MKHQKILFWVLLVLLSRIPLVAGGYGADGDAWRVAESSLRLWNEGIYEVSRLPGFPAHEFVNAVFIGIGGSTASNLATCIVFLLSLYPLRQILRIWDVPMPDAFLVVYSFLPLVWKNSAVTIDYLWGLTGVITSIWLVLDKRFVVAGILLGLAAGTRLTHLAFILPILLLIHSGESKNRMMFAASAVGMAVACYVPVFLSSSLGEMAELFSFPMWRDSFCNTVGVLFYRVVYSMGLLGAAGVFAVLVLQRGKVRELRSHVGFLFSCICIVMVLLMFAVLPGEREYLIPMTPFLLIVIFLIGTKLQIAVTSFLLLSFSLVSLDVIQHDTPTPQPRLALVQGLVLKEHSDRAELGEWKKKVVSIDVPDSSIVMTGRGPIFGLENDEVEPAREFSELLRQSCYRSRSKTGVYYVYSLNFHQLADMRGRGFAVYYTDDAKLYLEKFLGYRLDEEGVGKLKIRRD